MARKSKRKLAVRTKDILIQTELRKLRNQKHTKIKDSHNNYNAISNGNKKENIWYLLRRLRFDREDRDLDFNPSDFLWPFSPPNHPPIVKPTLFLNADPFDDSILFFSDISPVTSKYFRPMSI